MPTCSMSRKETKDHNEKPIVLTTIVGTLSLRAVKLVTAASGNQTLPGLISYRLQPMIWFVNELGRHLKEYCSAGPIYC